MGPTGFTYWKHFQNVLLWAGSRLEKPQLTWGHWEPKKEFSLPQPYFPLRDSEDAHTGMAAVIITSWL